MIAALFIISGLACAVPVVAPPLAPLGWFAFAPAAVALALLYGPDGKHKGRFRRAYAYGLVFFESYGLVLFSFFRKLYPLEFVDGMTRAGALAVVVAAWVGLSMLQTVVAALQFALFALAAKRMSRRAYYAAAPLLSASLWCLFEWFQTLTWAGVPWGRLALGQTSLLPMIQTASLFGSYFIDFILVFAGSTLASAFLQLRFYVKTEKTDIGLLKRSVVYASAAVFLLAVNYLTGVIIIKTAPEDEKTISVAALQGNFASSEKWDADRLDSIIDTYADLTDKAAGADLIVWPETALPITANNKTEFMDYILRQAEKGGGVTLASAFWRFENDDTGTETTSPSVICIEDDGRIDGVYAKRHLVPFGEYLPWADFFMALIPPLTQLTLYDTVLSPGDEASVFDTSLGRIGTLICFDSIYENLIRDSVREGAQLIAVSTNDSWFTDSAAVWQHNAHSLLRAVETKRWIVRSANTGVSSIISPNGEVVEKLDPLQKGIVKGNVGIRSDTTLYVIIGDLFVLICLLASVFITFSPYVYKLIKRKS